MVKPQGTTHSRVNLHPVPFSLSITTKLSTTTSVKIHLYIAVYNKHNCESDPNTLSNNNHIGEPDPITALNNNYISESTSISYFATTTSVNLTPVPYFTTTTSVSLPPCRIQQPHLTAKPNTVFNNNHPPSQR